MQERSELPVKATIDGEPFVSTRHRDAEPDTFDPNEPRLGRRESEPHSAEVSYLHDVLTTNFPDDRTIWDLHHYFKKDGMDIDLQFDISYFKGLKIPYTLSSYKADEFDNRIPTMAINILSKSTWRSDLAEKLDFCRILKIPLYIVYSTYHVAINIYKPPFLRAYVLQSNNEYKMYELRRTISRTPEGFDLNTIIDVSEVVPFRLGLQENEQKHQGEQSLYRLVLVDPNTDQFFLTENEKKSRTIDEQSKTIDEQSKTINEQSRTIDQLNVENLRLKNQLLQKKDK
jgi:Uma2 family endonuclease